MGSDQLTRDNFSLTQIVFFCGQPAKNCGKRKSQEVVAVRTIELKEKILEICRECSDAWAAAVQARILTVHDLHIIGNLGTSLSVRLGRD